MLLYNSTSDDDNVDEEHDDDEHDDWMTIDIWDG